MVFKGRFLQQLNFLERRVGGRGRSAARVQQVGRGSVGLKRGVVASRVGHNGRGCARGRYEAGEAVAAVVTAVGTQTAAGTSSGGAPISGTPGPAPS